MGSTAQEIADHLPMVQRIVSHFMRRLPRSVQREDLVAAGTVGLFRALQSSEHTSPEMFASYARIRIHGSIVDELRRHDWSPRRRKDPNGDAAVPAASSGATGATGATGAARSSARPAAPRVVVLGFDDLTSQCAQGTANDNASPLDQVLERCAHEELHAAVEGLPPRERDIVRMRYFRGVKSRDIALAMNLSEARVSQLHARAMKRLKDMLDDTEEMKLAA